MSANNLSVRVASGDALDVRDFVVEDGISRLFEVRLVAVSANTDVDFEATIGAAARFQIRTSTAGGDRAWAGICSQIEQTEVDETGLSTYALRIVPKLWLLTQRKNYRVFQDKSELEVALEILGQWGIEPESKLDAGGYPKRRIRVQYAETDFDFVSRMLEDIGVAYYFMQAGDDTKLVLADAPNRNGPRDPIPFLDSPNPRTATEYATAVHTRREVRPGRYTQSDVDYRKALGYPLAASASRGGGIETKLERYHHNYGSFLWKASGGETPFADDRGAARTNEREGKKQVDKRLDAQRVDARVGTFRTTAYDVSPGRVIRIKGHPRGEVAGPQLVVACLFTGTWAGDWVLQCETRYADVDYRPALKTPKPRTHGVESATVTGPAGEEIHTDEFGRVRVHFPWDREGATDETSSCWIPVSQPWAGAGFGAISLPRVGQEVFVDFLGADPDRPLVLGRVFTTTTPPPYALPEHKMVSGLRSESYPREKPAGAPARMGGGLAAAPMVPAGGGIPATRLGGAAPADLTVPAGAQSAPTPLPGVFGGKQAQPKELDDAITQMKSDGPDGVDQKRKANAVTMDDRAGSEKLYLQAQRDLRIATKNNLTGAVGANRAFVVYGNDFEDIANGCQMTQVRWHRNVEIGGDQQHTVEGEILQKGHKNQVTSIQENLYTEAVTGSQFLQANTGIILRVSNSATILMTPTAIVIDAEKVFINPGKDVMDKIYAGMSPEAAMAQKQKEDRIASTTAGMVKYMKDAGLTGKMAREKLLAAGGDDPNGAKFREAIKQQGVTAADERQAVVDRTNQQLGEPNGP